MTLTLNDVIRDRIADPEFRWSFLKYKFLLRVGHQIRELARAAGLSVLQLAQRAGLDEKDQAFIAKEDYSNLTMAKLQQLACAANYHPGVVFISLPKMPE